MTILDNIEQIKPLLIVQGLKSKIIENEQLRLRNLG